MLYREPPRTSTAFMKIQAINAGRESKEEPESWDKGNRVAAVLVSNKGEVLLKKQPRTYGSINDSIEIFAEYYKHENPLEAVKADLWDTLGCDTEQCQWYYLGHFAPHPEKSRSVVFLFLATNANFAPAKLTFDEIFSGHPCVPGESYFSIPFAEAIKIMEDYEDDRLVDPSSVIALTRAKEILKDLL